MERYFNSNIRIVVILPQLKARKNCIKSGRIKINSLKLQPNDN